MPSSPFAGRQIAAGLLAALIAVPALAQDPEWQINRIPSETILATLGVPETDDVRMQIACDPANRFDLVMSTFYMTPHRETRTPAMAFTVDGTTFVRGLRFKPFSPFYGGYEAEVVVAADDPLLSAMRAGRQLSATLHPPNGANTTITLSLAGSAAAIDNLLQQCGHERS